jgi:hypothetical protein
MTHPIARDPMYRRRAFDADIIEFVSAGTSYRDLVAMMAERDVDTR